MVLGKVLSLEEIKGVGLKMVARVDGAIRNDPHLKTIYEQIKRGTITGLSIGGWFKRKMTPAGIRIYDMDFSEISVTATPVLANGTSFTVEKGKAIEAAEDAEWLAKKLAERELDRIALTLSVAEMRLASR